jgi:hypothetical protein
MVPAETAVAVQPLIDLIEEYFLVVNVDRFVNRSINVVSSLLGGLQIHYS